MAISEEFANNASGAVKSGGLMFDRRVTRTITPGTLIDEKFMDPYENNFLLALYSTKLDHPVQLSQGDSIPVNLAKGAIPSLLVSKSVGMAWLDLSTGDFFTQTATLGTLPSAAARIGAREIVLSDDLEDNIRQSILHTLEQQQQLVRYHRNETVNTSMSSWTPMLETEIPINMQISFTGEEVSAGSLLLSYVQDKLHGLGIKLQPPVRKQDKETMSIDKNSMRALEVLGTSKEGLGGGKGSLLHTVRRTVTKSGTRLLRDWIASPSMSLEIINARLDLVSHFIQNRTFREDIQSLLRRSFDSQRLVQKFSMGRGDADDLVSLLRTIEATNSIANILKNQIRSGDTSSAPNQLDHHRYHTLQKLCDRLSLGGPNALAALITASIDEDGLMESHRVQDNEGADIVAMVQNVLQNEGSAEDQAAISRVTRSRVKQKASAEPEVEEQESWILRKRCLTVTFRSTVSSLNNIQRQHRFREVA